MKLRIGGVPYKVTFVDSWKEVDHNTDSASGLMGEIRYDKGSIKVATDVPPELVRRVLMHEILHGIINAYRITALKDSKNRHNEDAIDQLAVGICEVLESMKMKLPIA